MKTIYKNNYCNDGIFIDLDVSYEPYDNLLCNHNKYLNIIFIVKKDLKVKKLLLY